MDPWEQYDEKPIDVHNKSNVEQSKEDNSQTSTNITQTYIQSIDRLPHVITEEKQFDTSLHDFSKTNSDQCVYTINRANSIPNQSISSPNQTSSGSYQSTFANNQTDSSFSQCVSTSNQNATDFVQSTSLPHLPTNIENDSSSMSNLSDSNSNKIVSETLKVSSDVNIEKNTSRTTSIKSLISCNVEKTDLSLTKVTESECITTYTSTNSNLDVSIVNNFV